ncbi:MAG: serine/threonine-protein kinase [Limisphaerales bacterium]
MSGSDHRSPYNEQGPSAENQPSIPGLELLRPIARGSYGEIWLARTELGTFRAVKIIRRANFADARPYDREFAGIQRYEPISREHEGLVDVLQVARDEDAGLFYYVMELADDAAAPRGAGVMENLRDGAETRPNHSTTPTFQHPGSYTPLTLAHLIRQRQRLPASEVIEIGIGLAHALDFLHCRRLVHRDVKPSNIIFVGGQPKLADVGLVADLGNPRSLVGTEGYIPPEGPGSVQADIYSLGKVLYEAATGKDRQEFPDLPTRLGEGYDDPALPELNEVFLKACESNPRARYSSAAQMAADLQRLKAGQSLRALRARRHRRRSVGSCVAVIVGLALVVVSLIALIQYRLSQPRLLLHDDFDAPQLNTDLWTWGHRDFGVLGAGRRRSQVEQSSGELVLQANADHEDGNTAGESVWVDLERDLRLLGPCRIEMEVTRKSDQRSFIVVMANTKAPPQSFDDPSGAKLVDFDGDENESLASPIVRLRIDLLPTCQAAVVYPDTTRLEEFDIVDLHALPVWRLRLLCHAVTARSFPGAKVDFRIRKVLVFGNPKRDDVVGRVLAQPSKWPVADALIKDRLGRPLAKTSAHGAFVVPRSHATTSLTIEKKGYSPSDARLLAATAIRRVLTVRLRKVTQEFGDVVDTINYRGLEATSIGFRGDILTLLVRDSNTACRLLPVELAPRSAAPVVRGGLKLEFPTNQVISDFVECGSRLVGIRRWPGVLIDLNSAPPRLVLELKHARDDGESTVTCPYGATFDGSSLWFLESDATNQRFGLHAVDLQRQAITKFLPSIDKHIQGLAWDGRFFWISNAKGRVYAIERDVAVSRGTVETGIGPEFRGNYTRLAFGQGYLWGLEPEKHRICKMKITD